MATSRVPVPVEDAATVTEPFLVDAEGLVPDALFVPWGATEVGTTALDDADAVDVPPGFEAVTVKV